MRGRELTVRLSSSEEFWLEFFLRDACNRTIEKIAFYERIGITAQYTADELTRINSLLAKLAAARARHHVIAA